MNLDLKINKVNASGRFYRLWLTGCLLLASVQVSAHECDTLMDRDPLRLQIYFVTNPHQNIYALNTNFSVFNRGAVFQPVARSNSQLEFSVASLVDSQNVGIHFLVDRRKMNIGVLDRSMLFPAGNFRTDTLVTEPTSFICDGRVACVAAPDGRYFYNLESKTVSPPFYLSQGVASDRVESSRGSDYRSVRLDDVPFLIDLKNHAIFKTPMLEAPAYASFGSNLRPLEKGLVAVTQTSPAANKIIVKHLSLPPEITSSQFVTTDGGSIFAVSRTGDGSIQLHSFNPFAKKKAAISSSKVPVSLNELAEIDRNLRVVIEQQNVYVIFGSVHILELNSRISILNKPNSVFHPRLAYNFKRTEDRLEFIAANWVPYSVGVLDGSDLVAERLIVNRTSSRVVHVVDLTVSGGHSEVRLPSFAEQVLVLGRNYLIAKTGDSVLVLDRSGLLLRSYALSPLEREQGRLIRIDSEEVMIHVPGRELRSVRVND